MRYISDGAPWPEEKIVEFVERQKDHFAKLGYCLWKLVLKSNNRFIGFCGLQPLDDLPGVEIGWWLSSEMWGQGLATEAAQTALQDGFGRVGLDRIVAVALAANRASTRIMEKLGMKYEEDVEHQGFRVVLYSMDRKRS